MCVCVLRVVSFQLCVNITNERLRQHVSEVLFQQEQAECLREGVAMETPRSPCEQPAVLDFFLQVGVVERDHTLRTSLPQSGFLVVS